MPLDKPQKYPPGHSLNIIHRGVCLLNGIAHYSYIYILSGMWSSPAISGTRSPQATNFTLTSIDECRAVMFGGREGEHLYKICDVYFVNFLTMVQT